MPPALLLFGERAEGKDEGWEIGEAGDRRRHERGAGRLRGIQGRTTARGPRALQWRWQPGCFDRLLRANESAQQKWEYMRENPVRAALVSKWQAWPYRIGFDPPRLHQPPSAL